MPLHGASRLFRPQPAPALVAVTALIPTAAGVAPRRRASCTGALRLPRRDGIQPLLRRALVLSTIALRCWGRLVGSDALLAALLRRRGAPAPAALTYGEPARLLDPANLRLLFSLLLCGGAHFTYNLLSFQILEQTSPVTHVVLHALRRVVVIAASSRLTSHDLTLRNWAGIAIASAGVLGYALG